MDLLAQPAPFVAARIFSLLDDLVHLPQAPNVNIALTKAPCLLNKQVCMSILEDKG